MWRAIGSGIIINLCLMWARGYFLQIVFWKNTSRRRYILLGMISSSLLAAVPLLNRRPIFEGVVYTQASIYQHPTTRPVLIGVLLVLSVIVYGLVRKSPTHKSILSIGLFLAILLVVLWSLATYPHIIFLSRALIALVEERTKTSTNLALFDRFHIVPSDIMFFWLISALWFSFVENIVYLIHIEPSSWWAIWIIIKRMLTSRVMHLTYTWLISLGIHALIQTKKNYLSRGGFLITGIMVHALFNYGLRSTNSLVTVTVLIFWYFFLSWLISRSDRIYLS